MQAGSAGSADGEGERAVPSAGLAVDDLAYEQASRALEQQAGVLNELRQRTSTLVAVTALVATFLGGQALRQPAHHHGSKFALASALLFLLFGIAACLAVLVPTRTRKRRRGKEIARTRYEPPHPEEVVALSFSMNVEVLLDRAEERGIELPETILLDAARTLQLAWNENSSIVAGKQRAFVWGCVALLVQTASWIAFIALGTEVIG